MPRAQVTRGPNQREGTDWDAPHSRTGGRPQGAQHPCKRSSKSKVGRALASPTETELLAADPHRAGDHTDEPLPRCSPRPLHRYRPGRGPPPPHHHNTSRTPRQAGSCPPQWPRSNALSSPWFEHGRRARVMRARACASLSSDNQRARSPWEPPGSAAECCRDPRPHAPQRRPGATRVRRLRSASLRETQRPAHRDFEKCEKPCRLLASWQLVKTRDFQNRIAP